MLKGMDIQRLSMGMATERVQEQAGMAVLRMAMGIAKDQSSTLTTIMEGSAHTAPVDPALGTRVDLLV